MARTNEHLLMCREPAVLIARWDGAAPCEKTISEGVFEQGLHAEVYSALQ